MSARADLVIPTIGRPALRTLLRALAGGEGPRLGLMVIVNDRRGPRTPLPVHEAVGAAHEVRVVRGKGAGPAAARNTGWRLTSAPWVAFLDDDVVPERLWRARLAADLDAVPLEVAGSQGVIRVPRPSGRRPTDHERGVIGLERAAWATADMAYRRSVLGGLGSFDDASGGRTGRRRLALPALSAVTGSCGAGARCATPSAPPGRQRRCGHGG